MLIWYYFYSLENDFLINLVYGLQFFSLSMYNMVVIRLIRAMTNNRKSGPKEAHREGATTLDGAVGGPSGLP